MKFFTFIFCLLFSAKASLVFSKNIVFFEAHDRISDHSSIQSYNECTGSTQSLTPESQGRIPLYGVSPDGQYMITWDSNYWWGIVLLKFATNQKIVLKIDSSDNRSLYAFSGNGRFLFFRTGNDIAVIDFKKTISDIGDNTDAVIQYTPELQTYKYVFGVTHSKPLLLPSYDGSYAIFTFIQSDETCDTSFNRYHFATKTSDNLFFSRSCAWGGSLSADEKKFLFVTNYDPEISRFIELDLEAQIGAESEVAIMQYSKPASKPNYTSDGRILFSVFSDFPTKETKLFYQNRDRNRSPLPINLGANVDHYSPFIGPKCD